MCSADPVVVSESTLLTDGPHADKRVEPVSPAAPSVPAAPAKKEYDVAEEWARLRALWNKAGLGEDPPKMMLDLMDEFEDTQFPR